MKAHQVKILINKQVSDRYYLLKVDISSIEEKIEPGQFFNLRCSDQLYPFLRRPISVYKINRYNQTLEFLYLVKGLGTKKLAQLKEGQILDMFGPLGQGFHLQDEYDTILLLARGVGIATLAALAQKASEDNRKVIGILSARSQNDLLSADYLSDMGVEIHKVTDEEGTSDINSVTYLIEEILQEYHIKALYTCGSKRLSRLMQEVARREQLPGEIALEEHMGCAMGVCFACVCDLNDGSTTKSVRVCVDGPVFPLEQVVIS
ncbi:dihydroorotate dehydrogenase electron transfer subunit [Metabacillus halosaccharovorans]|uniref:Dihydroorotate dehydrogenase electron transfer subunit n=1 Tax=Metabacillus halosaccharovorans TaxID=930124 RepID=A0ABT3DLX2_9BACI|nr:dihydroorotate dehydrogenase electron transfer subunit [Metabacillus halosaccharovorans]MCV9887866.1 dihydroorotate dehydrogenase electron transfer subunit [Metabacillus halosaccharovorans]